MIKVEISSYFFLEWFLRSLQPTICKYVSLFGVFIEEEAIFRAQKLVLIYSRSSVLYEIFIDASIPQMDLYKMKPGPHANGVVGSISSNTISLLVN